METFNIIENQSFVNDNKNFRLYQLSSLNSDIKKTNNILNIDNTIIDNTNMDNIIIENIMNKQYIILIKFINICKIIGIKHKLYNKLVSTYITRNNIEYIKERKIIDNYMEENNMTNEDKTLIENLNKNIIYLKSFTNTVILIYNKELSIMDFFNRIKFYNNNNSSKIIEDLDNLYKLFENIDIENLSKIYNEIIVKLINKYNIHLDKYRNKIKDKYLCNILKELDNIVLNEATILSNILVFIYAINNYIEKNFNYKNFSQIEKEIKKIFKENIIVKEQVKYNITKMRSINDECPICYDEKINYNIWNCSHKICECCFKQLLKAHDNEKVSCPMCRNEELNKHGCSIKNKTTNLINYHLLFKFINHNIYNYSNKSIKDKILYIEKIIRVCYTLNEYIYTENLSDNINLSNYNLQSYIVSSFTNICNTLNDKIIKNKELNNNFISFINSILYDVYNKEFEELINTNIIE